MSIKKFLVMFFCLIFLLTSLVFSVENETIYQVSVIDALMQGSYEGRIDVDNLLKYGDTGIGTMEALDGEVIIKNGVVYKMTADGQIIKVASTEMLPFASIAFFEKENESKIKDSMDFKQFQDFVASKMDNKNVFYLIVFEGTFSFVKVRSLLKQYQPYKNLLYVVKNEQRVFEKSEEMKGTIIGFYCPSLVKAVNIPGFHFHFLNDKENFGGHVLDFRLEKGKVYLDKKNFLLLDLGNPDLLKNLEFESDKSAALNVVEKGE